MLLTAVFVTAGCARRPGDDVLRAVAQTAPEARNVTVYVATSRARQTPGTNIFNKIHAQDLNYAVFTISIPPTHKPGVIEWAKGVPDPRTDFVTVRERALDKAEFEQAVRKDSGGKRENIGIFVHGYNTNFPEALFRHVQMSADAGVTEGGAAILFAWPSAASYSGYITDRDAATASRDQLVDLLVSVTKGSGRGQSILFGHSMGGWMVSEALRQLKLTGRDDVIKKLNVILAAPDIDAEVFRTQMSVIGPLSPPMKILVSPDDVALSVSSLLSGNKLRVGQIDVSDPAVQAAARAAKVQIIDISDIEAGDRFLHERFAAVAALYPKISAQQDKGDGLQRAGAFMFDAAAATVSAPFVLGANIVAGR